MTPSSKRQTNLRLDPEILEGLQRLKERDGIPISEQVRRALRVWLESKNVLEEPERKRAVTRKRS